MAEMADWKIFQKTAEPHDAIDHLHEAPAWRRFDGPILKERTWPKTQKEAAESNERGASFELTDEMVEMVNAALYLRRPLLLTGKPGSGKSSLIYAVARQLKLGDVLRWAITSRSGLKDALYLYDALGRLNAQQLISQARHVPAGAGSTGIEEPDTHAGESTIGDFLRLGPLGTALLPTSRPRALLIDEIDKSDIDLPNDLLNVLDEGEYHIPELERARNPVTEVKAGDGSESFPIERGHVRCRQFPLVIMTSNGEREFPAPFLRRCLQLTMPKLDVPLLTKIVAAHLGEDAARQAKAMIGDFAKRSDKEALAADQLLNAVFLVTRQGTGFDGTERERVLKAIQRELAAPSPVSH